PGVEIPFSKNISSRRQKLFESFATTYRLYGAIYLEINDVQAPFQIMPNGTNIGDMEYLPIRGKKKLINSWW
ncbi:MAG: hypothetical protein WBJ37_13490, partial [Bacteroidales bacterium]